MNHEVELWEFRPAGLPPCQDFGSGKVFEVPVVCDDVDWGWSSFEVVAPGLERFEDGQEFFVVHIVVQFWGRESSRVKGYRVGLVVRRVDSREDGT